MKPMLFGKYCLLERISVGGMAEVFRSKPFDTPDFRGYLALKRILPHLAEDDEFIKMFVDEAKLTVQLNHPNIVRIFELGQFQASYYILMEFISGKDILALQKTMRKQRNVIPVDQSMFIAREIARGLHHAHFARDENGSPLNIIHRDVSPQNVLLDYRGRVKVIDFGIAKAAVQSTRTQVGVLKGKMGYMSPEQVRGEALDFRSDVFAIGTVLWEMLTNRRLFHADNEFETMRLVREAVAEPPSSRNPDVPPEVDAIIMRALTRDPEDRYESAGALADAIDDWLSRNPYGAEELSVWMRTVYADDLAAEREKRDDFAAIVTADDVRALMRAAAEEKPAQPGEAQSGEQSVDPSHEVTPGDSSRAPSLAEVSGEGQGEDAYEKTEIWDAEIVPDEGEDLAAFAAQHTVVQAGGFDASLIDDQEIGGLDSPPADSNAGSASSTPPEHRGIASEPGSDQHQTQQPQAQVAQRPARARQVTVDPGRTNDAFANQGTSPGATDTGPSTTFYIVAAISVLLAMVGVASVLAVFALDLRGDDAGRETPVAEGALVVNVTPPDDIQVLVDGRSVGTASPVTADGLTGGAHVIEAKAEGFKSYRETVEVKPTGITHLSIQLEPDAPPVGRLRISLPAERAGAALYIDGERQIVPAEGPAEFELGAGPHLVEFLRPGSRPFSMAKEVQADGVSELTIEPESVKRELEILANSKATVRFDGKRLGRGNVTATEIDPFETHEVRVDVRSVGVSSWSSTLGYPQIAKGSIRVDFDKPLPPRYKDSEFGYLQVSTGDDWWEVLIDGVETGVASPIGVENRLPVNAGKHKLTFRRGDTTIERDIEIVARETFLFRETLDFEYTPPDAQ